ncbi:TetR/AcrR family transcriptional regulator [Bdellovibrio reynosensis]|uniref:TetR/AcrR family transcriptional regulator n=1 Tax=Bdellovibrio reynosensis TaxID=2835041 RepID=A0ABY4CAL9_9BACT|nr:TetR family transcriptional regulator [Bdellovibrio reynosensis]UOF02018.1 TetR/AcrR family transcriptional regulator [Bdellovibrio reynosensis]
MSTQSKEDIYFAVCNAILKMEVAQGHLQWTLSEISRESGVTRSLIYYYFGKEKESALQEAYKFVIAHFFNVERVKTTSLQERLKIILMDIRKMPFLFVLFFLEKNGGGEVGKLLQQAEKMMLLTMKQEFPDLSDDQILAIYLKELGAIAYQLPTEKIKDVF